MLGEFDPELKAAISRIREAAKTAGKFSGIYCPSGDIARGYADEGFQMVSSSEISAKVVLTCYFRSPA